MGKTDFNFSLSKQIIFRWLPRYGASLIVGSQVKNTKLYFIRSHHGTSTYSCIIFPCYLDMEFNAKTQMNNNKDCRVGQSTTMVYRLHHIRRTWGPTSRLCPSRPRPQGQYLQGKADVNHSRKNMQMMQTFQVNHLHLWLQHLMRCELVLFKGYHGLPLGHVLLWNWNWIGYLKGCCCLPRGHLLLWNQRISPLAQQVGFPGTQYKT